VGRSLPSRIDYRPPCALLEPLRDVPLDPDTLLQCPAGHGARRRHAHYLRFGARRLVSASVEGLRGKVAVVTGAGSGIGLALAEEFTAQGMKVVLADVDNAKLRAVEAALAARAGHVLAVTCDVSLAESVDELAKQALEHFGAVHVLCNNAGVVGRANAWTGPLAEWEWVLGINLYGVVHGVRAFLPIMLDQGEGHIVNTASMAGLTALPGAVPYGVSKHGVVAISEGLYLELRTIGSPIGVSCLCPGFVRTDLVNSPWIARLGDPPPAADDAVGSMVFDLMRAGIESGIGPSAVAREVVDAIRHDRFWILTHPEVRWAPVARMRRAAREENPPLGQESRHPELSRLVRILRSKLPRRSARP
jgi:NAD(P)-dependent dehydrogenase (short-subunit alcohol dehydrogenase family)